MVPVIAAPRGLNQMSMLGRNGKNHIQDRKPFVPGLGVAFKESPVLGTEERAIDDGKERVHGLEIVVEESISQLAMRHRVKFHRPRDGDIQVIQVVVDGMKREVIILSLALAGLQRPGQSLSTVSSFPLQSLHPSNLRVLPHEPCRPGAFGAIEVLLHAVNRI